MKALHVTVVLWLIGVAALASAELKVDNVTASSPFRIFYKGEPINFEVQVSGANLPAEVPLVVRQLRNYYDSSIEKWNVFKGLNRPTAVVARGTADVSTKDGKTILTFNLDAPRLGAMRIFANIDGTETPLADYLHIMPPNDVSPDESTFAVDMTNPGNFPLYHRAGLKVVRWETGMAYKGKSEEFDFRNDLARLESLKENNMRAFIIIGHDANSEWIRFPGTNRVISYAGGNKPETQPPPRRMPEFGRWCEAFAGVMKGYVRGYEFFNEPWEGGSISGASGGGAQVRRLLAAGAPKIKNVDPAAKIVAGCSIMNEEDSFLPYPDTLALIDVLSTHTYYNWNDYAIPVAKRLGKEVWDTESWCVMTDDHGPMKSAHQLHQGYKIIEPLGANMDITSSTDPWTSGTASYLTGQRFLDGMKAAGVAMKGKVPTILLFEGRGRAVAFIHNISISGPGGAGFPGNVPYRQQEPDAASPDYKAPGSLSISAANGITAYDVFGNPLAQEGGSIRVPIGRFGSYVVASDLATLKSTLEAGKLEGISPFYIKIRDLTERPAAGAKLRLQLTNVYPAAQEATVTVDGGEALSFDTNTAKASFGPGEEKVLEFTIKSIKASPINKYHINVTATSANGTSRYNENINAAVIVEGSPTIDGDLSDWHNLNPVPVYLTKQSEYLDIIAKYMQLPFAQIAQKQNGTYMIKAQFAWDRKNLYISAQISDPTETRSESLAFGQRAQHYPWPNQHLYLGPPQLAGVSGDCLLLSFNTNDNNDHVWDFLSPDHPLYRVYPWPDTDYEFEIHPVAYNAQRDKYFAANFGKIRDRKTGESTSAWPGYPESETWRLYDPKMTFRHHAYPFNMPTQEYDQGLVPGATSTVNRQDQTWVYEAAIPWSQLWEIEPKTGNTITFSFYTRNDGGHGLEYAEGKSVSFRNVLTAHPMWEYMWSCDTEWGFVK